jgi:2-C-methyl-D-erythritol 4-phosphate cytidylyltransferase
MAAGAPTAMSSPGAFELHALVPAAGRGERFGGGVPKQFLRIAGRPVVAWTVERLLESGCASIVVALPEDRLDSAAEIATDRRVSFVAGGATRQASVATALEASPARSRDLVAVHDGARAAVSTADIAATAVAATRHDGALLGRAVTDTVKSVAGGLVVGTVDRVRLFRAETPQIFRRETLERALEAARRDRFVGTDEASLVERLAGVSIAAVEAQHPNPKLTYREDLEALERALTAGSRQ